MVLTEEERCERHRLANKSYYQRQKERTCQFCVIYLQVTKKN